MACAMSRSTVALLIVCAGALSACAGRSDVRADTDLKQLASLQLKAQQAYVSGHIATAVGDYEQLTQRVPHDAQLWFKLANAYVHSGRINDAGHAYERALTLKHDMAKAWHNLGIVRMRQAEAAFAQSARMSDAAADVKASSQRLADGIAQLAGSSDSKAPDTRSANAAERGKRGAP